MKPGYWHTYFACSESYNERVFEHFNALGNILAATWEAEATWAHVEVMGRRSHIGTARELPHGWIEVMPLNPDGTMGTPIRYGPAAIFAIRDLEEDEARRLVCGTSPPTDSNNDDEDCPY